MAPIAVLLIDDSVTFLRGLRGWLEDEPGMRVVGEAVCAEEALAQAARLQPQVAVVDLRLKWRLAEDEPAPDNGWRLAAALGDLTPAPAVLILTGSLEGAWLARLAQAGACGCLRKEDDPAAIALAVRAVAAGMAVWTPGQLALLHANRVDPLSPREREVLALLAQGCPNAEIGRRLGVHVRTVDKHIEHLLAKLGAHNRTEAVAAARARGLMDQGG